MQPAAGDGGDVDDDGDLVEDFPGASEQLQRMWPALCWEISGVRAMGTGFLTNFRLILDCTHSELEPLDISLCDVRSMHLEIPLGVIDSVKLLPKSARIRQWTPDTEVFVEEQVSEVCVHCADIREVHLFGLEMVQQIVGDDDIPIYSAEATQELFELLCGSPKEPAKGGGGDKRRPRMAWLKCFAVCGGRTPPPRGPAPAQGGPPASRSRTPTPSRTPSATPHARTERRRVTRRSWLGRTLEHIAKMPNPGAVFVEACGRPTLGWDICEDAHVEFFERQGTPRDKWRLTTANWDYKVCGTYPRSLAVPSGADDDLVRAEAKCRTKQRLPVLTYYHQARGSALLRCSQPADGRQGKDKDYLELCRKAVHQLAALIIFDCRSQVAARANRLRGGGQEDPRQYAIGADGCRSGDVQSATVISLDVPNMHDMLSSWSALQNLVNRSDVADNRWLQLLGDTMWLDHCRRITESAVSVARALNGEADGKPPACVVVHCSDGWDRTTQVCALAQLLACKRFRTREGFSELVEKDWRRFGHRFADRSITDGSHAAPIFLQWLFCVYMVVDQFPDEFEFGSRDLKLLADLRLCGGIGTFLFNSEQEAREARAERHQISVWAVWLQSQRAPELLPTKSANMADWARMVSREKSDRFAAANRGDLLLPITSLKSVHLWSWALRYDEVAFARQKAYSTSVGRSNPQRLGRSLVVMLRESGASECKGCRCDFGLTRRRNHCRGCGLLFCATCVQWRAHLSPHDLAVAVSALPQSEASPKEEQRPSLRLQRSTSSQRFGRLFSGAGGPLDMVCRRCFELLRGDQLCRRTSWTLSPKTGFTEFTIAAPSLQSPV